MPRSNWRRTSPSNVDLLDASVWAPLSAPDHVHHARAREYWESESAEHIAFCRVTMLALVRYLTNPHVMRHAVLSARDAWEVYLRWRALPEIVYLNEPDNVDGHLARFASELSLGAASWTDAYLAAISMAGNCRLVAFDAGMSRFSGVDLLHLAP